MLSYFSQIRFQEVGGTIETAFSQPLNENLLKVVEVDGFQRTTIIPITTAIACIQKCWSDGFYLSQIFVRFWKLTLQILARTAQWIDEFSAIDKWRGTEHSLVEILVFLYINVTRLDQELPSILATISGKLDEQQMKNSTLLEQCFAESKSTLQTRLIAIQTRLVKEIVKQSSLHVKQVSDIPRMFRKTNRDVPAKAFAYVDQMLDSPSQFANKYQSQVDAAVVRHVLTNIFCELNHQ